VKGILAWRIAQHLGRISTTGFFGTVDAASHARRYEHYYQHTRFIRGCSMSIEAPSTNSLPTSLFHYFSRFFKYVPRFSSLLLFFPLTLTYYYTLLTLPHLTRSPILSHYPSICLSITNRITFPNFHENQTSTALQRRRYPTRSKITNFIIAIGKS
jgi:hypothetical protein